MNNKVKVALISIMLSVLIHVIIIYLRLIKRIDLSISIGVITYFGLSYFLLMKYYKYKKTVLIGINIPYLIFYIPILLISFNRIHFISIIPNFLFLLSSIFAILVINKNRFRKCVYTTGITLFAIIYGAYIHSSYTDFLANYINRLPLNGIVKNQKITNDLVLLNSSFEKVNISSKKDKLFVLDVWNKYCSPCFEKFEDFEKTKNKFVSEKNMFWSVGFPIKDDTLKELKDIQDSLGFTFDDYYSVDDSLLKQLDFRTVPTLILIKNNEVLYKGSSYYWLNKAIKKFQ